MSLSPVSLNDTERLIIEYRQWKLTQQLRDKFMQHFPVRKQEWLYNTFDRWLLSLHEDESGLYERDEQFPLYPKGLFSEDVVHDVIVKEIAKEIRPPSISKAQDLMSEFLQFLSKKKQELLQEYNQKPELKLVDSHECSLSSQRSVAIKSMQVGEMTTKASRRIAVLCEQFGMEVTAIMLLRYESLGTGSYQWGDPAEIHKTYYDFGARYEGFASPLNSRFLGQKDAKFCSLFPDTDAVFGSLGNFMKIDFSQHPGGWTVNPPFIESLLEAVADKILAALDAASGTPGCLYFFSCMPHWEDTPGWIKLNNSRHMRKHVSFGKCRYVVQDAYQDPLDPNCGLSHFVLGYLPEKFVDSINKLEKIMNNTFRKWENIVHGPPQQSSRKRSNPYLDHQPLFKESRRHS